MEWLPPQQYSRLVPAGAKEISRFRAFPVPDRCRQPIGAGMSRRSALTAAGSVPAPDDAARALAAAAEAAVCDLERRVPAGISPLERALAARIRAAAARLLVCADQLATDELMIPGSTG